MRNLITNSLYNLDIEVLRPASVETTALGAAIAAGRAVGEWDLKVRC